MKHALYVYAEDAYGNWGKAELTLNGFRVEPGQKIGDADDLCRHDGAGGRCCRPYPL